MKKIKVFAPATVSNVACGFDVMGFAIDNPGDEVILSLSDKDKVEIVNITGDDGKLPYDVEKNTAGKAVLSLLEEKNIKVGIDIEINKKMPIGSGLGSSAASAAAAVFALDKLLDLKLSNDEMIKFALEGEKIASGSVHADNIAPCLLGGFVLIRGYDPIDVIQIPVPDNLFCTIVYPHLEIKTNYARKVLRKEIKLSDAIIQWGNTAGLIAGLFLNDVGIISRSLKDVIIEPMRADLIPSFYDIKEIALAKGALGCSISGSGPSIFSMATSIEISQAIAKGISDKFRSIGLESNTYISPISKLGCRIME